MKECYGFAKINRIRKNFEFKRARDKGTSYRDGVFILTIMRNNMGCHRLGVSVSSRKISLASQRNRLKRLIKEVFRVTKTKLKNGSYDIVVSVRRALDGKPDFSSVEKRLISLFRKAKAL